MPEPGKQWTIHLVIEARDAEQDQSESLVEMHMDVKGVVADYKDIAQLCLTAITVGERVVRGKTSRRDGDGGQ